MSCDYPATSTLSSMQTQAVTVSVWRGWKELQNHLISSQTLNLHKIKKSPCISRPRMIIEKRKKKWKKKNNNTSSLLISLLQRRKSHCIHPPTAVTVLSLTFSICQCEELLLPRHSSHPLLCFVSRLRGRKCTSSSSTW